MQPPCANGTVCGRLRNEQGQQHSGARSGPATRRRGSARFLNQATKLYTYFVFDLPVREPVAFGPFVNLIVVWNRGISYGLFQQNTELGRWALVVISILASIALGIWIRRTSA